MPEMSVLLPLVAMLMVIGAFAGVLAGLLGVGGGIILVPAFFYAFQVLGYGGDQLMQVCLATSLATIIVTSVRSVLSHNKKGAVDWDILRTWAPGIAIGAILGVPGRRFTSVCDTSGDLWLPWHCHRSLPWFRETGMAACGCDAQRDQTRDLQSHCWIYVSPDGDWRR